MTDTDPRDAAADLFVSPDWLAERLNQPSVVPVDGSWYLPAQNRNAQAEFAEAHVPGAAFFDIDALADTGTPLPHMLPEPDWFGREAGALGIPSDATLVVYDGAGLFSAPRVWWTLKVYGARDVRLLDGGFPAWTAAGLPVEAGRSRRQPAIFRAAAPGSAVAALADVRGALADGSAQVVDARPAARFAGAAPEPRPGLAAGHMPGSHSVPATDVIANGRLKAPADLEAVFTAAGVDPARPIITSCGSGVTAAILTLALARLGHTETRLYDGSWAEYGARADLPVARD
jgi:thiosulfate/3-mercaptopyruvate sulfurtransferase